MIYLKSLKKSLVAFASIAFFGQVHVFSSHLGLRAVEPISNRGAVLRLSAATAAGLGYAYLMDNHKRASEFRSRDDSARYIQAPAISLVVMGLIVARRHPRFILAKCNFELDCLKDLQVYGYAMQNNGFRPSLDYIGNDVAPKCSLKKLQSQSTLGLYTVRKINNQLRKPLIADMHEARSLLSESLKIQEALLNLSGAFPQKFYETRLIKNSGSKPSIEGSVGKGMAIGFALLGVAALLDGIV